MKQETREVKRENMDDQKLKKKRGERKVIFGKGGRR